MPAVATPVKRGCGSRQSGAIYLECGLAGWQPIEHFLFDPPLTEVPEEWLTPHRMPELLERDGVTHVVIWVGEGDYPNVWDFIEETRVAGASRRISKTFDFSKLTENSRMYFVHAEADVAVEYEKEPVTVDPHCPKDIHGPKTRAGSPEFSAHCLGLAKYLPSPAPNDYADTRIKDQPVIDHRRTLPCGHAYDVFLVPDTVQLTAKPGVFLQLPITGICCVTKEDGSFDAEVKARVAKAHVPVYEADQ